MKINNIEKTTYLSDSDTILDFFCNKAIINEDKSASTVFSPKKLVMPIITTLRT